MKISLVAGIKVTLMKGWKKNMFRKLSASVVFLNVSELCDTMFSDKVTVKLDGSGMHVKCETVS